MSSRKIATIGPLGGILVLAFVFAWHFLQATRQGRKELNDLEAKLTRLGSNVEQAQKRVALREQDLEKLRAGIKSKNQAASAKSRAKLKDPATLIAADPKLRDLYLRSYRANLATRFGTMFKALGSTQAQIDKFEDLATARESEHMDIRAAALAQGLNPDDPASQTLEKQSKQRYLAAMASVFGNGIGPQLSEMSHLQSAEGMLNFMGEMTPPGETPLTSLQDAQMLQILTSSSPDYQSGQKIDPTSVNWDAAYAKAAAVLSGPQLQAFNGEAQFFRIAAKANQFYSQEQPSK